MSERSERMEITSAVLLAIADCLRDEAESCNRYQQLPSCPPSQSDSLYVRAGLLLSLETVCRKAQDRIEELGILEMV